MAVADAPCELGLIWVGVQAPASESSQPPTPITNKHMHVQYGLQRSGTKGHGSSMHVIPDRSDEIVYLVFSNVLKHFESADYVEI